MSYYAQITYTSTGSQTNFAVPFPYLNLTDVYVFVNGVATAYTLISPGNIQVTPAPANGTSVLIQRQTQAASQDATFNGGSLASSDLNLDVTQLLYLAQERADQQLNTATAAGPLGVVATVAALRQMTNSAAFSVVNLISHATVGDLGGGRFVYDATDTSSADNGGTTIVDASNRRWKRSYAGEPVSVTWWGTGTADDGPAFNSALAFSSSVYVPPRTYTIATPINLAAGKFLNGAGRLATTLSGSVAGSPVIQMASGQDTFGFNNMTIKHSVTATAGGHGFSQTGSCDHGLIHDVLFISNYHGCFVGTTGLSRFDRCEFSANVLDGFHAETQNIAGALQWYMTDCVAAQNGQDGYSFASTVGQTGAGGSLGALTACNTFANGRYGMLFLGTSTYVLNGVRVMGGFLGNDGADGIHLDTYGIYNYLAPEDVELSGGAGIFVSANTKTVTIRAGVLSQNGNEGIFSAAPILTDISGGQIISNGSASISTRQSGIFIDSAAGSLTAISGVVSTNINGTTSQKFGIAATVAVDLAVSGCTLTGNNTSAVTGISATSKVAGCLPSTVNQ